MTCGEWEGWGGGGEVRDRGQGGRGLGGQGRGEGCVYACHVMTCGGRERQCREHRDGLLQGELAAALRVME